MTNKTPVAESAEADVPLEKQAELKASPENAENLAEAVMTNTEKNLPSFVIKGGGLWEMWATTTQLSQYRLNRYRDYDEMATDSLIAGALELVTDDACQFSQDRGRSIWPARGADTQWVEAALRTLKAEDNIWGWTFNTALYGDFLPQLLLEKDKSTKTGLKFRALDSSIHPKEVRRLDIDGDLAGFLTMEDHGKVETHSPWEFVHFMLNNRPRFERHKLRMKGKGTDYTPQRGDQTGKPVIATSMYGTSWLDPARQTFRVLKLMEQALALARLNRSPLIRVFYVNTSGMTPKERKETLDALHQKFKSNLSMDMRQNFYKSDYNPLSFNADLFIPVTDGVGQMTAETLGGELNIKDIVDVDYQKSKLFAALRIPQAYLGFEEAMPGAIGSTTLVRLDIRYARSVKKIQRAILSGVTRLLEIMYALERGEKPDPKKISVEMEVISGVEELDRMEALERKLGVAQQFLQMTMELEGKIDSVPLLKYIFDQVLGLKDISKELKIGEMGDKEGGEPGGSSRFGGAPQFASFQIEEALKNGDMDLGALAALIEGSRTTKYFEGAGRILSTDVKVPNAGSVNPERFEYVEDIIQETFESPESPEASGEEDISDDVPESLIREPEESLENLSPGARKVADLTLRARETGGPIE